MGQVRISDYTLSVPTPALGLYCEVFLLFELLYTMIYTCVDHVYLNCPVDRYVDHCAPIPAFTVKFEALQLVLATLTLDYDF